MLMRASARRRQATQGVPRGASVLSIICWVVGQAGGCRQCRLSPFGSTMLSMMATRSSGLTLCHLPLPAQQVRSFEFLQAGFGGVACSREKSVEEVAGAPTSLVRDEEPDYRHDGAPIVCA